MHPTRLCNRIFFFCLVRLLACYTIYNEKYFSERQLSCIVRVLTWRTQKMRSSTSSEGSRLVRIVVPCAQARRDAFSSEARGEVCSIA